MLMIDLFFPILRSILLACSVAIENVARNGCLVPNSGYFESADSLNSGTPSLSLIIIALRPLILDEIEKLLFF